MHTAELFVEVNVNPTAESMQILTSFSSHMLQARAGLPSVLRVDLGYSDANFLLARETS